MNKNFQNLHPGDYSTERECKLNFLLVSGLTFMLFFNYHLPFPLKLKEIVWFQFINVKKKSNATHWSTITQFIDLQAAGQKQSNANQLFWSNLSNCYFFVLSYVCMYSMLPVYWNTVSLTGFDIVLGTIKGDPINPLS